MNHPPFSVAMCVYYKDNPDHFILAFESIINQSVPPNEYVLVVDGPVPEALESAITSFESKVQIKIIRILKNQGHGYARRICLEQCTNELIALMDADDISVLDRFEKQLKIFSLDSRISIVGGNISEFIDEPTNVIGFRNVPTSNTDIKRYMKTRCPMNQVTVMFKKSDVDRVGGYIDWYCEEDYYLWLRLMIDGCEFSNIDDVLVKVRVGKEMYQRRGGWKYFISEVKLQDFMIKQKIISVPLYIVNIFKRFVIQVLMPNRVRGWMFQKFAREKA